MLNTIDFRIKYLTTIDKTHLYGLFVAQKDQLFMFDLCVLEGNQFEMEVQKRLLNDRNAIVIVECN